MWFEPTNLLKADKPFHSDLWQNITYASPNIFELRTMYNAVTKQSNNENEHSSGDWATDPFMTMSLDDIISKSITMCHPLLQHLHCVIVTLGKHGVLVCRDTPANTPFLPIKEFKSCGFSKHRGLVSAVHYPNVPYAEPINVVNVTGAGDRYVKCCDCW